MTTLRSLGPVLRGMPRAEPSRSVRVRNHASLDSTNSEALRLARAGERGPLWIVARDQTAGRGRRGREWVSAAGNLAASLLFTSSVAPAVAATLGFVASLAVCETCRALAPGPIFALKWPNDVLANGGKVAGLLLESEAQGGALAIVVGIGVNLASAPEGMPFPADVACRTGASRDSAEDAVFRPDGHLGRPAWPSGMAAADLTISGRLWLAQAQGIGQVDLGATGTGSKPAFLRRWTSRGG